MNTNQMEKYKEMLIKERNEIIDTIHDLEEEHEGSLQESTNELSVYDNHPADIGTETFMQEQNINLKDREKMILNKIDIALKNIEEDNYGNCVLCGKEIEEERLDIIPYTVTCIDHREEVERAIMSDRPVEEEFLKNSFGRTNKDNSEENYVGTDGEDILQRVEEFNKIEKDPSNNGGDMFDVFDENESGAVEDVENIPEGYYKGQLSNENREDIPDDQKE